MKFLDAGTGTVDTAFVFCSTFYYAQVIKNQLIEVLSVDERLLATVHDVVRCYGAVVQNDLSNLV